MYLYHERNSENRGLQRRRNEDYKGEETRITKEKKRGLQRRRNEDYKGEETRITKEKKRKTVKKEGRHWQQIGAVSIGCALL
jgi:hypothetical protein